MAMSSMPMVIMQKSVSVKLVLMSWANLANFSRYFPRIQTQVPLIMVGGGFLQDKIRIHDGDNTAPQIHGDYKKGYDRLNNGWMLSGTVGYLYLSDSRLINFFIGLEFMQSWTKYRRARNFDTGITGQQFAFQPVLWGQSKMDYSALQKKTKRLLSLLMNGDFLII